MRALEFITENKSTTIEKLYGGDYPERDELFWDYVRPDELNRDLTIQTMPKHKLKIMLQSQYRVEHLDEILDMMDEDQQAVLQRYMNDPNLSNQIILIADDRIIDGNHRALAAAMNSMPINYVDLADLDELDEMALAKYKTFGDFTKPGPFRGADKKLVPHPKNIQKATTFFENTPYDFRLFFTNVPGFGKYSEHGEMNPGEIRNIFNKEQADEIINGSEDAITVVFVGNKGDSKVMMTPWIMAHRFGHAVQAGTRMKGGGSPWVAAEEHFFRGINELLRDFYGIEKNNIFTTKLNWNLQKEYSALFNAIGTQRSSRTGQIKRPYEFFYELFAQYLGTGKITLNPLPKKKEYGRKAWGRSTQSLNMQPGSEEESQYTTEILARDMELMFDDVLSSSVGKIFVM
jgi:hypothetical protein